MVPPEDRPHPEVPPDEAPRRSTALLRDRRRARVLNLRRDPIGWLTDGEKAEGRKLPLLRSECKDGPRPCPYVTCRYHLYLDVNPKTGNIKLNFPNAELEDLPGTCALDVADSGPQTLEVVGAYLNVTRERERQIEEQVLRKMRIVCAKLGVTPEEFMPGDRPSRDEMFPAVESGSALTLLPRLSRKKKATEPEDDEEQEAERDEDGDEEEKPSDED